MPIFEIKKTKAIQASIQENGFGNEVELRDFFAENLEEILGIRFLEKEYPTTDGRIDTLGVDENNSPVIIEYKWRENEGVFAQGLFYFNWLMKNRRHFELLVDNKLGIKTKVNWEQPRVILIAQGFSRYILGAVQREKNIELKTYARYQSNLLQIENIYTPSGIKLSKTGKADKSGKDYNIEHHLKITSFKMKKMFDKLRLKIIALPEVKENFGSSGIYYQTTKSFTRFEFRPSWIQVLIREPRYKKDNKKLVKDVTSNKWGYKGMIKFKPDSEVDYIFDLIKLSYESTL